MEEVAVFRKPNDQRISILYAPENECGNLEGPGRFSLTQFDAAIVPRGVHWRLTPEECAYFESVLGVEDVETFRIVKREIYENPVTTLVAVPSRRNGHLRRNGNLRGIVFVPSDNTACCNRFHRFDPDFFFNVAFEAIAYASEKWEARELAISEFSLMQSHDGNIMAPCAIEALARYCETWENSIQSFALLGGLQRGAISAIRQLKAVIDEEALGRRWDPDELPADQIGNRHLPGIPTGRVQLGNWDERGGPTTYRRPVSARFEVSRWVDLVRLEWHPRAW